MTNQSEGLLPEEQLTLEAYDQVAAQWAAEHDDPKYWSLELDLFHQLLPQGSILEIGSGGGRDAKELIALGYHYTGTDISTGLLQVAKQALPGQIFVQQSVYDLSFWPEFDGFWASAVLLHVPRSRIHQALSQIRRNLRVGAIGFISLKDGQGEQVETEIFDDREIRRHFTYWTREEFEAILPSASFELVDYIFHPRSARTRWHCFFVRAT